MKKFLFFSLLPLVMMCFVDTKAVATSLEASCKDNKTNIQCVDDACKAFISSHKDKIKDYGSLMEQLRKDYYDILNDKCSNELAKLNSYLKKRTTDYDFSINCPESPVSNATTTAYLNIDLAKLKKPEYKSPFYFVFANSELSTAEEIRSNTITYNDECSEYFGSNPDDEDHLNIKLQNADITDYKDTGIYDTMEYFMNARGILSGNYDAPGMDTACCGSYEDNVRNEFKRHNWEQLYTKGNNSFMQIGFVGYTNVPIKYTKLDKAEPVFTTIVEALDGTQCEGFWLHLVDSNGEIIMSQEVGA